MSGFGKKNVLEVRTTFSLPSTPLYVMASYFLLSLFFKIWLGLLPIALNSTVKVKFNQI